MRSLLVLGKGDTPYSDRNRVRLLDLARKERVEVREADYHQIGHIPSFSNGVINVFPFFPYTFWNERCETPSDTRLYGTSRAAYEEFRDCFLEARERLEERFRGQRLNYLIPLEAAARDRDKIETIKMLRDEGISTPKPVDYSSLQDVIDAIGRRRGVFIKCRYGADGKGITVMRHDRWVTNYKVEGGRLGNYGAHDLWPFTDITGRKGLIRELLQHEVIVEREIRTPNLFEGQKFDVRAYVVGENVPHFFVRVNAKEKEVTNFSQGARVIHNPDTGLKAICKSLIRSIASETAAVLDLKFVGVDIMFDGRYTRPRVVEVQAFTDFPYIKKFDMENYIVSSKSGLLV